MKIEQQTTPLIVIYQYIWQCTLYDCQFSKEAEVMWSRDHGVIERISIFSGISTCSGSFHSVNLYNQLVWILREDKQTIATRHIPSIASKILFWSSGILQSLSVILMSKPYKIVQNNSSSQYSNVVIPIHTKSPLKDYSSETSADSSWINLLSHRRFEILYGWPGHSCSRICWYRPANPAYKTRWYIRARFKRINSRNFENIPVVWRSLEGYRHLGIHKLSQNALGRSFLLWTRTIFFAVDP